MPRPVTRVLAALALLLTAVPAHGETGRAAWLRYAPVDAAARASYAALHGPVRPLHDSAVMRAAAGELTRGLGSMLGSPSAGARAGGIVLGTPDEVRRAFPRAGVPASLAADGFWIGSAGPAWIVAAQTDRGVLYGAFALLQRVALERPLPREPWSETPSAPVRWVNEWDNLDGTIERGYAGPSIFFEDGHVAADLTRVSEYGRLLASVGINGITINNVNANPQVLTPAFLPELVRVADALRPWGVALSISVDFSSPMRIGSLETFDPLDGHVAAFWQSRVDAIYAAIPDFGGFVLKADSEGRLGPSAYGRTHADAANVIARALAPHHGLLFYRGFVYDNHMDWRDPKNDRARAAVDNFTPLDGRFLPNVALQVKNGPIDFQVREPASPLFAALHDTTEAIELQITQEYLGQQRHVVYTVPMWKATLDFDMQVHGPGSPVKTLVGGFIGVANVGRDDDWLGHDLAMANLYGFGRLAWNPDADARAIADDWTMLTFGRDPTVVATIGGILMDSWPAYERYTGNLGIGTLTDILHVHYGPGIESSERNGWGQWHRADGLGVGMDRTVATGTGFTAQYPPAVAARFESLATTPDELLLFFHHVPYTYRLKNGKTVIQHIYDEHYTGAAQAAGFVDRWRTLEGLVDRERYEAVLKRLEYQAGHAIVWRDAVVNWFRWISATADGHGRVGHVAGRIEAEHMALEGFTTVAVDPWETASGALAAACVTGRTCAATYRYDGADGRVDLAVQYFDESDGASRFRLLVAGQLVDSWVADGDVPSPTPNGHTSTRRTAHGVALHHGDAIRIEVDADGGESGAVDYLEIHPSVAAPPAADRAAPRTDRNSLLAHEQLLEKAKRGGIDVYVIGDSIARRWGATDYPQYLANWRQNFFGWNAADFGWGADRTENILWRLENGELDGVNPKVIVILAGTNNVGREPGGEGRVADITRGLAAIVRLCRTKAPAATIVLTGIFPRNDSLSVLPEIARINANLAALADGTRVRYVNVNDRLANADGILFDGMMNADKLHPALPGYQVWADALKPILTEILGPPAATDHAPPPTGDPAARR